MNEANRHIIQQQFFDIRSATQQDSLELQQQISQLYWEAIAPALERLFDAYATSEEVLRIDRLEIDLGTLDRDKLAEELVEAIVRAVREQLDELTLGNSLFKENIQRLPVRHHQFDQWLLFLETGTPAWNAQGIDEAEQETLVLEMLASEQFAIQRLNILFRRQPHTLDRVIRQYPDTFLARLVEVFTGTAHGELPAMQRLLEKIVRHQLFIPTAPPPLRALHRSLFWKHLFQKVAVARKKLNSIEVIVTFIQENWPIQALYNSLSAWQREAKSWSADEQRLFEAIFQQNKLQEFLSEKESSPVETLELPNQKKKPEDTPAEATDTPSEKPKENEPPEEIDEHRLSQSDAELQAEKERERLANDQEEKRPGEPPAKMVDEQSTHTTKEDAETLEQDKRPTAEKQSSEGKSYDHHSTDPIDFFKKLPADTSYYVENAGIILLHPFLAHYFRGGELLQDKHFKDAEAQELAVHLLYYLATKEEHPAEPKLLLPKFLCGLPFPHPIDRYLELPEALKQEAENVLQAALNHWGALPNTSPDGLREGFLQRDGKLEKRGDDWFLLVESKTLDILLNKLPWNISLVKLPWLKDLLRVEWNH